LVSLTDRQQASVGACEIVISETPHWTILPAVVSVRWEDGMKTGSASSNAAVCGADRRQSKTTGLLQEHTCLAPAMPATNNGPRLFYQLLLKQWTAPVSKFLQTTWKNFHTGRGVAI